jgi:hypothetical protein
MNQYPEYDNEFDDRTLSEVTKHEGGWEVKFDESWCFFIKEPSPVEPEVGMICRTYGRVGYPIRGVFLNGKRVFYRTKEEEDERHKEWAAEQDAAKKAKFEENKEKYFQRISALPLVFQKRFDKFSSTNPDFNWDFGEYELFCCEQAYLLASTLGTYEKLNEFAKKEWEEQRKEFPGLSDEHSGNTFGFSVRLAYHYLTNKENVVKEHGSLTTLVGCEKFGCPHNNLERSEEE